MFALVFLESTLYELQPTVIQAMMISNNNVFVFIMRASYDANQPRGFFASAELALLSKPFSTIYGFIY